MHADRDQERMDVNPLGLSQEEAQELRAELDAESWQGMLSLQHALANAPMLAPSIGFSERVLRTLAVQERRRARRRSIIGGSAFALGCVIVTALLLWLSPLSAMAQPSGWAALLNGVASFIGVAVVLLQIAATFVRVLATLLGGGTAVLLALVALLMTLLWTRIAGGWTPLNRPEPV